MLETGTPRIDSVGQPFHVSKRSSVETHTLRVSYKVSYLSCPQYSGGQEKYRKEIFPLDALFLIC